MERSISIGGNRLSSGLLWEPTQFQCAYKGASHQPEMLCRSQVFGFRVRDISPNRRPLKFISRGDRRGDPGRGAVFRSARPGQAVLFGKIFRVDVFHVKVAVNDAIGLGLFRLVPEDGCFGFTQAHTLAPIGHFAPEEAYENRAFKQFIV